MAKFVLDCGTVLDISNQINSFTSAMDALSSDVSSYDVQCDDFDFESAKQAIVINLKSSVIKMKNTVKLIETVIDAHTSLQNSLIYEPVLPKKSETIDSGNVISKSDSVVHTVSEGENLSEIAKTYDTSVETIARDNNINDVDLIYKGETLIINESDSKSIDTNENISINENNYLANTTDYLTNPTAGFVLTTGNKTYELSQSDRELLMAIVSAEADNSSKDDCLAVVSVILNRCENQAWINSYGTNPISQATAPNQFVVYQNGNYTKYLNGNVNENVRKAVEDALNGIRNCEYLSFRSNASTSYSNNMIVSTGNRYA